MANLKYRSAKKNNLLGEIVQLFDTTGQEIKQKQADAQLKALELAEKQLNQPSEVPTWVIVMIPVVIIGIGVGLWLALRKK